MEEKIWEKAKNAIRGILEAAGYEVSPVEDPFFLAEREGEYLLVLCSNDQTEIKEFDTTSYRVMQEGKEITYKKLLFSLADSPPAENSIVWGTSEFVRFAGEASLARILDRTLSLSLAAPGGSPGQKAEPQGAGGKDRAPEEEPPGMVIPHLPIRVSRQAAEQIARTQGSASLRFMPYWVYHYVSSGEQVYKNQRVGFDSEGNGGINAINGASMEFDPGAAEEKGVPQSAEVVKPHILKEEAVEKIVSGVIEQLTQKVRIKQAKGDAIFYEEKVIKPDRRNISVTISQIYVPVWQVRGKKIVEINAFSGEVLSEPMDEGVEIL